APSAPDARTLAGAMLEVCRDLARAIAADGEGAQHLLTVRVQGAESRMAARQLARAVVESNLTKAAFFGTDPNWRRVLAAMGGRASELGIGFDLGAVTIRLQEIVVFQAGAPTAFDADALRALLRGEEVLVDVAVGAGSFEATAWGCDLSYDYVRI